MITLVIFLAILSILVLVHEGGHFLAAKKAKILVEEFGFGYPPKLLKKKIGETIYSLNWIIFGGFVRLYGEEPESYSPKAKNSKKAFWAKSKKARAAVILAGVLANFLLAIVCFSVVYSFSGIPTKTKEVKIIGIAPNSPAEKVGLKDNDLVLEIDNQKVISLSDFTQVVNQKKGQEIKILIDRQVDNPSLENGKLIFFITPRELPPEGEGPLGVAVSNIKIIKYPFWQMPARGTAEGFKEAFGWGVLIVGSLKKMVVDLITRGVIPKDIAGPIGIFQITSGVAQQGILTLLQFMGILSVNLAVINILPLPAFDGGKMLFILYELVTKKRLKPSVEQKIVAVGVALMVLLIVLITINDIVRLMETTFLFPRLRSLLRF